MKRKFASKNGDLEDRWVQSRYIVTVCECWSHCVAQRWCWQRLCANTPCCNPLCFSESTLQFAGEHCRKSTHPPRRALVRDCIRPVATSAISPCSTLEPKRSLSRTTGNDWDLDEVLWRLADVCRAAPELQHTAGLYRHGGGGPQR